MFSGRQPQSHSQTFPHSVSYFLPNAIKCFGIYAFRILSQKFIPSRNRRWFTIECMKKRSYFYYSDIQPLELYLGYKTLRLRGTERNRCQYTISKRYRELTFPWHSLRAGMPWIVWNALLKLPTRVSISRENERGQSTRKLKKKKKTWRMQSTIDNFPNYFIDAQQCRAPDAIKSEWRVNEYNPPPTHSNRFIICIVIRNVFDIFDADISRVHFHPPPFLYFGCNVWRCKLTVIAPSPRKVAKKYNL